MGQSTKNQSEKKRVWIVILLFISCVAALYLWLYTEPPPVHTLRSPAQLDSLITETFREFDVNNSRIRTQTIEIDSVFSRKQYTVRVPQRFSKTSFHYILHNRIWPYNTETVGIVKFPDEDLHIHMAYNGTVHRSIILYSEDGD